MREARDKQENGEKEVMENGVRRRVRKKKKSKVILKRRSLEDWWLLAALAAWIRDATANKELTKSSDEAGHLFKALCQQIQSK